MSEQSIIVKFRYGASSLDPLRKVERGLEEAIAKAGIGEYDGDEIAVDLSEGSLYLYAVEANKLFAVIRPVLEAAPFMRGAVVIVRYGPPGAKESRLTLDGG